MDLKTNTEPEYNKPQLENNFFLASRKGVEIENFLGNNFP